MRLFLMRPSVADYNATRKMARAYGCPVEAMGSLDWLKRVMSQAPDQKWYALEVHPRATPLGYHAPPLAANYLIGPTAGTLEPAELDLMDGIIQIEQPPGRPGLLSTVGVASILMYEAYARTSR